MEIIKTDIEGVVIIKPRLFSDERGYFFESFSEREFCRTVENTHFVQDNESRSSYGVVRGLHYQRPPYTQAKLVRCTCGKVLDVAVDIRPDSPTFGKHIFVELSEDNHYQLYLPHGIAHGFSVLSDIAIFQYKCDNYYHPQSESGINPIDSKLRIDWKIPPQKMILSQKDLNHPDFINKEDLHLFKIQSKI